MIQKSIFILGRQPGIGRAELESLFGADHLMPLGDHAMASDIPLDEVPFARIGGAIRLAKPLATFSVTHWPGIVQQTVRQLPGYLDTIPEGKLKLGLSVFGLSVSPQQLLRAGLELKKACKNAGRSARVVPNKDIELNSAQVIHNQLTGNLGMELVFIRHGSETTVARTVAIQDIDAYAHRDQGRPKRDAFVGMLPPKLAQTIVNLGVAQLPPDMTHVVLDPFCGTGVVLQEALLMGYGAYGTDLEPRMIDFSRENLAWLATHGITINPQLEVGDATQHQWGHTFSAVAGETYLGRPLSSWPSPATFEEIKGACNVIIQKFLANMATQIPSSTRLCLAVPAWRSPDGRIHRLSLLDQLQVLGYNRVSFAWVREQEMVYYRPDQLVARELLVLIRK